MGIISTLAKEMASNFVENELADRLIESEHEILQEIGMQVLNEEGFPDWVELGDVDFIIELVSHYSFEDWAELAKSVFDIKNISYFVKEEAYDLYMEFIRLFDIKLYIKTSPEEIGM